MELVVKYINIRKKYQKPRRNERFMIKVERDQDQKFVRLFLSTNSINRNSSNYIKSSSAELFLHSIRKQLFI